MSFEGFRTNIAGLIVTLKRFAEVFTTAPRSRLYLQK
jgi:hypothetical protein